MHARIRIRAASATVVALGSLTVLAWGAVACGKSTDEAVDRVTQGFAPDPGSKPCGPKESFVSTFVPETWTGLCGASLDRVKVSFSPACVAHDTCYDTKGRAQEQCDTAFRDTLKTQCSSAYEPSGCGESRNACFGVANQYYAAVKEKGAAAYKRAQAALTATPTATPAP